MELYNFHRFDFVICSRGKEEAHVVSNLALH
jgi:hypothetical protein